MLFELLLYCYHCYIITLKSANNMRGELGPFFFGIRIQNVAKLYGRNECRFWLGTIMKTSLIDFQQIDRYVLQFRVVRLCGSLLAHIKIFPCFTVPKRYSSIIMMLHIYFACIWPLLLAHSTHTYISIPPNLSISWL